MKAPDPKKPYVGGQAVIEGVMMRSPRCLAIAVRRADGSIVVRDDAWTSIWERLRFLRWPFFRGAVILAESLYNGIQAINFAARQAEVGEGSELGSELEAESAPISGSSASNSSASTSSASRDAPADVQSRAERATSAPHKDKGPGSDSDRRSDASITFTIGLSFLIAIALFIGLPHLLAFLTDIALGRTPDLGSFSFHAFDGFFKVVIFVTYIAAIGRIPEIRRVFEYHGAEHKVVNVYEQGLDLTLEHARKQTTFHARCGTSFILFVLLLSILLFAAVFPLVPTVSKHAILNHLAMIALKVPLMLPLSGIAYEINRYAAFHPGQFWVQAIVLPGKAMQKLTTREPKDDQLEIALTAMQAALRREVEAQSRDMPREVSLSSEAPSHDAQGAGSDAIAPLSPAQVLVFRDYGEANAAIQTFR